MQSDFATRLKQAVSEAQVPPMPLAAIRSAANTRAPLAPSRRRPAAFYVFVVAILSGVTAAFGSQIWEKVHITVVPHGVTSIRAQNITTYWRPDAMQLRSLLSHASYRVTMPSGLPPETRLMNFGSMGTDVFLFDFSFPQGSGKKRTGVAMIVGNPKFLDVEEKTPGSSYWIVHGEEVLLLVNRLSAGQIAAIRHSMEVHPCMLPPVSTKEPQNSGRVLKACAYEFAPIKSMHVPQRTPRAPTVHYGP